MGTLRTDAWSRRALVPRLAAAAGRERLMPQVVAAEPPPETMRRQTLVTGAGALLIIATLVVVGCAAPAPAPVPSVKDPGVRGGPAAAGGPLPGLTSAELAFFDAGRAAFLAVATVKDGLGPRFNLDSCAGCHAQPAAGGSSPSENPQVAAATKAGAKNIVPFFITLNGPVRAARFKFKIDGTRDAGVHNLYTIAGRTDAPGCVLAQPDFKREAGRDNLTFRIPTPAFGAGLIEAITDETIMAAPQGGSSRRAMGIAGRPNRRGPGRVNTSSNDGSITRFGWKAQNKSLAIFAGEAYNVELGVTNELFPTERDETPTCLFKPAPEDHTKVYASTAIDAISDVTKFALFMRFLAPPEPASETPSSARGRLVFTEIGCALCHTPSLTTGRSSSAALSEKPVRLYSDLLLHRMGPRLTDNIVQGIAGPDEFRTAPLWGLGQRIFLLHDGRTTDLVEAIEAHASAGTPQFPQSEASTVTARFHALGRAQKQDLLNFLRSL
jgi:CxxC motif-containing protein (DUF1111 family)